MAEEFYLPVESSTITSGWYYNDGSDHRGVDFDDNGTECEVSVLASQGGTVTYVKNESCPNTYPNGPATFGCTITIEHPSGYITRYSHLCQGSAVVNVGDVVTAGQVIGTIGNSGYSTGSHLDFRVAPPGCNDWNLNSSCLEDPYKIHGYAYSYPDDATSATCGSGYLWNECPPVMGPSSTEAFTAIEDKSTELYWINRNEAVSPATPGLITTETQDISLDTALRDPYYVEYWDGGQWGEVLFTYDEGNEYQDDRAYVVRGGFLQYREAADPSDMGPPLGDEMDQTQVSTYTAYDSYCTPLYSGYDQEGIVNSCIEEYCGSSATYTSVQRFQYLTLCYNPSVGVECDPKWEAEHGSMNPACSREAEAVTATSTSTSEGNLWVYNSTIYWVHNGYTHGIVSSEMFEACGFDWADPYPVTEEVFESLPEGDTVHDPVSCGAVVDGTLVDQNGTVYEYWAEGASWHGYPSELVFNACLNDWNEVGTMTSSVFNTITIGSVIGNSVDCGVLSPGDLVHWNGTVYRITEGSLKRGFTSSDVFNACGYDWDLITYLADDDYPIVTTLQDGSGITSTSDCSNIQGDLVHWEWTGTVYYLTGTGYKRGITSPEAMTSCGFDWNQVRYVTNDNGAVVWTLGDEAAITGNGDCP